MFTCVVTFFLTLWELHYWHNASLGNQWNVIRETFLWWSLFHIMKDEKENTILFSKCYYFPIARMFLIVNNKTKVSEIKVIIYSNLYGLTSFWLPVATPKCMLSCPRIIINSNNLQDTNTVNNVLWNLLAYNLLPGLQKPRRKWATTKMVENRASSVYVWLLFEIFRKYLHANAWVTTV